MSEMKDMERISAELADAELQIGQLEDRVHAVEIHIRDASDQLTTILNEVKEFAEGVGRIQEDQTELVLRFNDLEKLVHRKTDGLSDNVINNCPRCTKKVGPGQRRCGHCQHTW